jgi:hypothetical protein
VTVPVVTVDEFVASEKLTSVDFIKVDVEGHELDFLKGGQGLLSRPDAPILMMENDPVNLVGRSHSARDVVVEVRRLGFEVYRIGSAGQLIIDSGTMSEVGRDILCVKTARRERLNRLQIEHSR